MAAAELSSRSSALVAKVGREAARAAARQALWRVGDLSWALHSRQLEARALVEAAVKRGVRRAVWMVGRRGGKTRYFVVDAFEFALKNPGSRIPYGALTWQSATGFVFPEVETLAAFAPADQRPEIVDGVVRFHNGSTIVVSGTDDERKANALRGPSAPRAYLDECGFNPVLDYVVKSVLAQQLLTTGGLLQMGSSPPDSPAHPFASVYVADAAARGALVRYRTRDAPHIRPADLAALAVELGGEQSIEYRRECDCELLTDESRAVIPEWRSHMDACVPPLVDGSPEWWPEAEEREWYVAADLGYIDLTAVLLGWWDFLGNRLVVEDERVLARPTSHSVQAATADMERDNGADRIVSRVADASLITIADMQRLEPAGTPEHARWKVTAKDDREGAINALRLMVARHEIVIHPRCKTLLAHVEFAIWNQRRTEFERSDGEGLGHFDALAALVYLARSVKRTRNPYPPAPPPSIQNQHVPAHLLRPPSQSIGKGWKRR